jgi:hypothetical protein
MEKPACWPLLGFRTVQDDIEERGIAPDSKNERAEMAPERAPFHGSSAGMRKGKTSHRRLGSPEKFPFNRQHDRR